MPAHTHADVAHQVVRKIILFTALAGRMTPLINFILYALNRNPKRKREREWTDIQTG
jgi:hypothetical protein